MRGGSRKGGCLLQETEMKRWNDFLNKDLEYPKIDAFLADITVVCQKHGFSISHEDSHGAFLIESYSGDYDQWLGDAYIGSKLGEHLATGDEK